MLIPNLATLVQLSKTRCYELSHASHPSEVRRCIFEWLVEAISRRIPVEVSLVIPDHLEAYQLIVSFLIQTRSQPMSSHGPTVHDRLVFEGAYALANLHVRLNFWHCKHRG